MSVNLHIDKLVLHGFSRKEARNIKKQIQHSLTELIAKRGLNGIGSISRDKVDLSSRPVRMNREARPEVTARKIARQIYSGISNPSSTRR